MKKSIICLCLFLSLIGCARIEYDESKLRSIVEKQFEDSQIVTLPNEVNKFIIKDKSGDIWFVKIDQVSFAVQKNNIFRK